MNVLEKKKINVLYAMMIKLYFQFQQVHVENVMMGKFLMRIMNALLAMKIVKLVNQIISIIV